MSTLAQRAAPDGERKTITALFADIKGSVELMQDLDPEEARAVVDPALQLMMDARSAKSAKHWKNPMSLQRLPYSRVACATVVASPPRASSVPSRY